MWETANFVKASPGRAKATFVGYDRETVENTASSPSPTNRGSQDFQKTWSIMSYPVYSYVAGDGTVHQVRESKAHIVEILKPGQELEIILLPPGYPHIAGFYSLYVRDLTILALGLCFIGIPLMIGSIVVPSLETGAGMALAASVRALYGQIASSKVGPITVTSLVKTVIVFFGLVLIISLAAGVIPYLRQLLPVFKSPLITALEQNRYDDAREMIVKRRGVNRVNEYKQSALLVALEKDQRELALMLIEAGANVNQRSVMAVTPLQLATRARDLEMVKVLLAKGASPDVPEDESPPIAYALLKGYDDIARVLIEAGTDVKRKYVAGDLAITVGDMALLARKPELAELIRQRGGIFTIPDNGTGP